MSNATALRAVWAHLQENLDDWRQDEWSNCFAGHTLRLLKGATEVGCCGDHLALAVDGETLHGFNIGVRAAQLLELDADQAQKLFRADNSLEELAQLIGKFAAEGADQPQMALVA